MQQLFSFNFYSAASNNIKTRKDIDKLELETTMTFQRFRLYSQFSSTQPNW